ncbi:hypothetical protein PybrP1_001975, partial [[Pythium] brassicae (nom. inval.)]
MTLSVFVTGYGLLRDAAHLGDTVVFYVSVQQGGSNSWTVYRRFESFQRLSTQLLTMFAGIPQCPPKTFDARSPESVERARVELSMWIIQLLHHHPIFTSHVFVEFVSAEANIPPPGLQQSAAQGGSGGSGGRHNIGELDMDEMFGSADDDAHSHDDMRDDDMFTFDYHTDLSGGDAQPFHLQTPQHHAQSQSVGQQQQRGGGARPEKVQLDDFTMIKVIGKGSFGKVLLVRKKDSGAIFAMKVLRKENIIKRNQVEHTRTERHVLGYKIRKGDLSFPKYLSVQAKDLLTKLLERDPTKRLGTGPDDAREIKNHPFFAEIQWDALALGQVPVPWRPTFSSAEDTSQFDREFTDMPIMSPDNHVRGIAMGRRPGGSGSSVVGSYNKELFKGFTYTED